MNKNTQPETVTWWPLHLEQPEQVEVVRRVTLPVVSWRPERTVEVVVRHTMLWPTWRNLNNTRTLETQVSESMVW